MNERAINIILIVLSVIAVLMLVGTAIILNRRERSIGRNCELVLQERAKGTGYTPIPKQCEKGE